jgi:hypothetical protein
LDIKNLTFEFLESEDQNKRINKFLGLLFIYLWFYSFYNNQTYNSLDKKKDFPKFIKIKKVLEKVLFEVFPWNNDFNLYLTNFFHFLKEDLVFSAKKEKNETQLMKSSEFLCCNWFLMRSQSLSVFINAFELIKESKNNELFEDLIELKEFLWSYPKIDHIAMFLKKNTGKIVNLNMNKFLDENNLFPLNFQNEKRVLKTNNVQIFKYLEDPEAKFGTEFLV